MCARSVTARRCWREALRTARPASGNTPHRLSSGAQLQEERSIALDGLLGVETLRGDPRPRRPQLSRGSGSADCVAHGLRPRRSVPHGEKSARSDRPRSHRRSRRCDCPGTEGHTPRPRRGRSPAPRTRREIRRHRQACSHRSTVFRPPANVTRPRDRRPAPVARSALVHRERLLLARPDQHQVGASRARLATERERLEQHLEPLAPQESPRVDEERRPLRKPEIPAKPEALSLFDRAEALGVDSMRQEVDPLRGKSRSQGLLLDGSGHGHDALRIATGTIAVQTAPMNARSQRPIAQASDVPR